MTGGLHSCTECAAKQDMGLASQKSSGDSGRQGFFSNMLI